MFLFRVYVYFNISTKMAEANFSCPLMPSEGTFNNSHLSLFSSSIIVNKSCRIFKYTSARTYIIKHKKSTMSIVVTNSCKLPGFTSFFIIRNSCEPEMPPKI